MKTLTLPLETYNKEMQDQYQAGLSTGASRLANIVLDIINNDGTNVEVTEGASPEILSFIAIVTAAVKKND